ncbi:hypothetical protein M2454_003078 [Aequitasia blattaphilus]|uniref:Uncharacterized protein n=1 Tax=Aequitasia blattaphilus TaxID=2949332 RepID=A0ABT1ED47_9FIRM|nr:hypothetical protein [Aequitasia blattaphilus]MCP1102771.1 hypothetical protein [Aequitasia blattaphilus]MCR8615411.1 hypothetical protein [Aequitasia blattaphilus]
MDKRFIEEQDVIFNAKPDAVPYNYRISYKVAQVCLILAKSCWGKSGCLPIKLHMISFALCSKEAMDKLLIFTQSEYAEVPIVRFDPAVNSAVTFGIADGLIFQGQNGKYALTDKGRFFVSKIEKESTVLSAEKKDLSLLSTKLTDAKIKQLSDIWRNIYAED